MDIPAIQPDTAPSTTPPSTTTPSVTLQLSSEVVCVTKKRRHGLNERGSRATLTDEVRLLRGENDDLRRKRDVQERRWKEESRAARDRFLREQRRVKEDLRRERARVEAAEERIRSLETALDCARAVIRLNHVEMERLRR